MKIVRNLLSILGLILLIASCNAETKDIPRDDPDKETHHPFLIVKKNQFQALRVKSEAEPWKSMKGDAIARAKTGSGIKPYDLQFYIGAAALAYILDEGDSQIYANKVRDAIINQYAQLELDNNGGWGKVVPPMGSFFVAILALDIVYNALSIEEIQKCENVISNQIFKIDRIGSWVDVRYGTHGAWDIYKGDRTRPDDDYYNVIMWQITEDGVSPVTNHYAWERVGGGNSRISKSGYMDVLEFTGIDPRYYKNEKLIKFHRWLFGSSVNCSKEMAIFGDMLPTQGISNDMLHRRVVNFDMQAAGYAAWFHEGTPAIGNILTYILPKQALPAPIIPSSKIYTNGGAFFREKNDNPNGIHAVLYNIMSQDEWHTHNEVNGLAISGYGNRLMVNGGRLGESVRAANLNNTLTINGNNHSVRIGGGIVEGFSTIELDYASGFSGLSLGNASHFRNLVLIHGTDNLNAYIVLFDEVEASIGNQILNYLHPANQSIVSSIVDGMEYEASIDHYPSVNGTKLTFFYGTTPSIVNIEKIQSAVPGRYPGYPTHNRLESVYEVNNDGNVNLVTVLFPHNASHTKPKMSRIAEYGFTGVSINHSSGLQDIIGESFGSQEFTYNNFTFNAKSFVSRTKDTKNIFYFVRHGRKFNQNGTGFESENQISIYSKSNNGIIISDGTKVRLEGPGMGSVQFDSSVEVLNSGVGFIEVILPKGTFDFYK